MSQSQVKKCDKPVTACANSDRKPGEKWTDGCCTSNLAEHRETEKLENAIALSASCTQLIAGFAIKPPLPSNSEPQKN